MRSSYYSRALTLSCKSSTSISSADTRVRSLFTCVMKLWLILGKNLSTLLSGCDRLLPPAALFSVFLKNRIRCNLFASTANLTLKTLTACTADTHGSLPTSKKLCNSNTLANRDNRLSIRYLHIYQQQQQYTASAKKFPNLIQGLNTWS